MFYEDADGDGYGNPYGDYAWSCEQPWGYSSDWTDCDDTDQYRNPGMPELLDIRDNDCDGQQDEDGNERLYRFYRTDADGKLKHRFSTSSSLSGWNSDGQWIDIYPADICTGAYSPWDGCTVNGDGTIDLWGGSYALSQLAQCTDGSQYRYELEDSGQYASLDANADWTCYTVGAVFSLSGAAIGDLLTSVDIYQHTSAVNSDYMYSDDPTEGDNDTDCYYTHWKMWGALDAG